VVCHDSEGRSQPSCPWLADHRPGRGRGSPCRERLGQKVQARPAAVHGTWRISRRLAQAERPWCERPRTPLRSGGRGSPRSQRLSGGPRSSSHRARLRRSDPGHPHGSPHTVPDLRSPPKPWTHARDSDEARPRSRPRGSPDRTGGREPRHETSPDRSARKPRNARAGEGPGAVRRPERQRRQGCKSFFGARAVLNQPRVPSRGRPPNIALVVRHVNIAILAWVRGIPQHCAWVSRRRFAQGDSWRPVPSPDQARQGAEHGRSAPAAGHGSPMRPARDEGRKGRNVRSPSKSKAGYPGR